jgi:hypothetical protein
MNASYLFLLSETILLPLLAGLIRLRRIDRNYLPFFVLIVLGALNENISYVLIKAIRNNAAPNNLYALLEWLFICWQFQVWGLLRTRRALFFSLVALVALIWVWEDLIRGQITTYPAYFQVIYGFFIVLFSVNTINFMITYDFRNLFGNPTFLICIGYILYYVYWIVVQWAYQTSLGSKTSTTNFIFMLNSYINALTNIIFAFALLRLPRPQKFILR